MFGLEQRAELLLAKRSIISECTFNGFDYELALRSVLFSLALLGLQ